MALMTFEELERRMPCRIIVSRGRAVLAVKSTAVTAFLGVPPRKLTCLSCWTAFFNERTEQDYGIRLGDFQGKQHGPIHRFQ